MKLPLLSLFVLVCILSRSGYGQPVVASDGVVNGASYLQPDLPNAAIAQGSIFVVFGSNLGPATLQEAKSFPLPMVLAGTSIEITSGSTSAAAIMIYTSATQLAAILPSSIAAGTASLTVTYNQQTDGVSIVVRS